eukprot:TRINITY_DN3862_c0_g1_i1.p1 TRINITY_DN3862_c0_g1~~TRINITY_DN3862_c0_g1_i1.p1  ORF type:complete len:230 (+),score=32.12 TRINITY_DN3862_c0_g1_i1:123-812(+)
MLVMLIEEVLPRDYYTKDVEGLQVEMAVLQALVNTKLPKLSAHLASIQCDLTPVFVQWFLCIFSNSLPITATLRVWDSLMLEGSKILFRVGLAALRLNEKAILQTDSPYDVYTILGNLLPADDPEAILSLINTAFDKVWLGGLSSSTLKQLRLQHQKELQTEHRLRPSIVTAPELQRLSVDSAREAFSTTNLNKPSRRGHHSVAFLVHQNRIQDALIIEDYDPSLNKSC